MRLYDRYLNTLAIVFTGTTVLLALYRQQRPDLYFAAFLIEYLTVTVVFSTLNARAQRLLSAAGYVLFGGFLAIFALRVFELLAAVGVL